MKQDTLECIQIRAMLKEAIGHGHDIDAEEAARLAGMKRRHLYAVMDGQIDGATAHLPALLNIPPFAERYMAAKGYAAVHVANEKGCPYEAVESNMTAVGEIAPMMSDRHLNHQERRKLALTVFLAPVRKMVAFMHRFRKQEVAAQ